MKDYTRAKKVAHGILKHILEQNVNAARLMDGVPPVVEVYGVTDEVLEITVDVRDSDK